MRQHTGSSANQARHEVRRELRASRSNLSDSVRALHDHEIVQHVLELISFHNVRSVACFWPFDGEPDLRPVYRELMIRGCEMALPVISTDNSHDMCFHAWTENTEMVNNRYGIAEPRNTEKILLPRFDMLLMPLVGYDRRGNRLGMGAGYYDRCLESLRDLPVPLRAGIAYSLQKIDSIEINNWDIPLHAVVNEHGWFTFVDEYPLTTSRED